MSHAVPIDAMTCHIAPQRNAVSAEAFSMEAF
jgi:hypothetical protein